MIFVDTPGIHSGEEKALNRERTAIRDVDVIVMVVDRDTWTEADEVVARRVERRQCPLIIAVNKTDRVDNKNQLLPHLEFLAGRFPDAEIIPLAALHGTNLDRLKTLIREKLPAGEFFFPDDQVTDRSQRFIAAEMVREKIMRQLGAELPYEAAVEIEQWRREGAVLHIHAVILVEREGQKRIVIGSKGQRIKRLGQEARLELERLLDTKVMLHLWVKVKAGWSDDERALKTLGYDDFQ